MTTFSSSTSTTSQTINGQTTGVSHSQQSQTTPSGTTTHTSSQNLGEPVNQETRHFDAQGRELPASTSGSSASNLIEDESTQQDKDAQYEERMEEEYAKREGGA